MTKDEIIEAVKELVARTGKVPGRQSFESETGIGRHEWYGRFWARWGDVLIASGFEPKEKNGAADKEQILAAYIRAIEEMGRLPTEGEVRVRRHSDPSFPGHEAIRSSLGRRAERIAALLSYAQNQGASELVLRVLEEAASPSNATLRHTTESATSSAADGFVYLMKSGKNYKVGHTNALDRRQYEIGVQLPEKIEPIHSIRTDDPSGIEAYWHTRFREKRLNGEWFRLATDDVRAFKRRKFM